MKGVRQSRFDLKFISARKFILGEEKTSLLYDHVTIESRRHSLRLRKSKKIVVNRQFLKRWLRDDGVRSYAFGHYMIDVIQCLDEILAKLE